MDQLVGTGNPRAGFVPEMRKCGFRAGAKIESFPHMERAAKSLARLKAAGVVSDDDLARAAWPVAVGQRLALRTRAVRMVRSTLIVEVEDAVWQKQLHQLRYQILPRLCQVLGHPIVEDVEFRVGVPRRPPQMSASAAGGDEAEFVLDPVMRIVYDRAKKKAIS